MDRNIEIESCRGMLNDMASMCEESSLTGSLASGAGRTALRYNAVLARLVELDAVSSALFPPLSEKADFGEIGVDARMLASFLKDQYGKKGRRRRDEDGEDTDGLDRSIVLRLAPFVSSEDLGELVREQMRQGSSFDMDTLPALAPFLKQELLGQLLRENLRKVHSLGPSTEPEQPAAPAAAPAPAPQPPSREIVSAEAPLDKIDDLVELLKNPHLSSDERSDLHARIRDAALRGG